MKVPMRWLNEYVKVNGPVEEYASRMVMSGTGVEGIEVTGSEFTNVVVGKILAIAPHEDSDHLMICQVDVGSETLQIVTGAPNVVKGQLVPVALHGAQLGDKQIKKGKLRGVVSEGMLCSGPELKVPEGLYPSIGDEGILIFQEEYPLGTDVKEIFGLNDAVVDFEILANRPDCLSIWGIARETAAVMDERLVMPNIQVEETGEGTLDDYATIRVEDPVLCPRYCARVVTDVKIGPSPKWMRAYLHAAGVRPINNIVDITNFVMLETGHPMHAFDLSKVREQTIVVRRAKSGEILTTLDGKQHQLTEEMLVIADAERATGLGGVMGGEESEIVSDTKAVLFECAAFDRTSIRLTSRALGIRTESSGRFERGVCPGTALEAVNRACMLVNQLECGRIVAGTYDYYPNPVKPAKIDASVDRINARISAKLDGDEMVDLLKRLNFDVERSGDQMTVVAPVYRMDIETEADVSEEVLRLYGYDHIPSTLMKGETMPGFRSKKQIMKDRLMATFIGMGYYQTETYPFISPKWLRALGVSEDDRRLNPVVLRNPLGEDTSVMRTSLVPDMLNTLSLNIHRGNGQGGLFEISPVYLKTGEAGALPEEPRMAVLGLMGEGVDFYTLKDALYCALERFGVAPEISAGGDDYYHPGRKAILTAKGHRIAQFGEIHPDIVEAFIDMAQKRVYVAELDMEVLMAVQEEISSVTALPRFPAVGRDIALVVSESVPVGPLMETVRKAAGKALEGIELFDIYRGAQLGEGLKNVAFALTFRAADHTLSDEEIAPLMKKIVGDCAYKHGAQIRG